MTALIGFFGICLGLFWVLVRVMKRIQFHQPIFELSPSTHQAKKNVPTLGGIGIAVGLGLAVFWVGPDSRVLWLTALAIVFAAIGLIDDGLSVAKKRNKGLSVVEKFTLQWAAAAALVIAYSAWISPLSIGVMAFYSLIIVGATNATNLTDGLDGLLAGSATISLLGFLTLFAANPTMSQWIILFILVLLAYIAFNGNPAQIFMGDTGSLQIGAVLAGMGIVYGNVWVLVPIGGIYIVETLSVILQVASYKLRKKRIFLMAPLHHHFELLGLNERQVVGLFWVAGLIFTLIGVLR